MRTKQGVLWIVLVTSLLHAAGCQALERPEVFVTNITPLESTAFEQRLRIDLRLQNPNDVELPVRGFDVKLDVNDVRLARGLSNEEFTVPALGEGQTSVVTSTSTLDLMRQLLGLRERPEVYYRLTGRLHLYGGLGRTVRFESAETVADLTEFAPGLSGFAPISSM